MSNKRNALGKGLGALLENSETDITTRIEPEMPHPSVGSVANIPVSQIEANPFQPRTDFEKEALEELSQSIKVQGIIQPVTVRKMGYDRYQLISGERRFRASQMAGLTSIPAFIRIANDQAMLEMALVENIQRANLNPIEIAISYKRLIEECKLTQEELSQRVGKNRSTVANFLRLLKLPAAIQLGIRDNRISMSHARAIINIENPQEQMKIFEEIIANNLSVRNAEDIARVVSKAPKQNATREISAKDLKVSEEIAAKLETRVELKRGFKGEGKIIVHYYSEHDLERILSMLNS